jgi:hypothetical protein
LSYADKQKGFGEFPACSRNLYAQAYSRNPKNQLQQEMLRKLTAQYRSMKNHLTWWEKVITNEEAERTDYAQYLTAAMKVGKVDQIDEMLKGSSFDENDFPELDFDW